MLKSNPQTAAEVEVARSAVHKIEEIQLELKGISACLILMHDAQEADTHEQGDRMAAASYYLGSQVRRLAQVIEVALYPRSKEALAEVAS